jgi:hypothetical protein
MQRVAETLGVSRSQLTDLLWLLRSLVDKRPTYGDRRITALINRERLKTGLPRLNHKGVYRLMSQNGSSGPVWAHSFE